MDGGVEVLEASPFMPTAILPSIPLWHMSTGPKPLSVAQVVIANIPVKKKMATQLEGIQ
jgi:hypothetical protein